MCLFLWADPIAAAGKPMSGDLATIRRLALAYPGVEERLCHGTPGFDLGRTFLRRVQEEGESLSIGCPRAARETLVDANPDTRSVPAHFERYDHLLLQFHGASRDLAHRLIEAAWRARAPEKAVQAFDAR